MSPVIRGSFTERDLQLGALNSSVLQSVLMCCGISRTRVPCSVLQSVLQSVLYSVLVLGALNSSVLQSVLVCCGIPRI